MNLVLSIVRFALAFLSFAGGIYKLFGFDAVADQPFFAALPRGGWGAVGAFEILCAILLVLPAAARWTRISAAAALVVESLVLGALYARYSLALTAANPLVWVVVIGVMALCVAYGARRMASVSASSPG